MKKFTLTSLLVSGLTIALIGCDAAQETVEQAKDTAKDTAGQAQDAGGMLLEKGKKAGSDMVESAKDLANIDFGDFDMKGLTEQLTGITDGFKDISAENIDGLTSKISDFTGSVGDMGIGDLTGPAKTAVDAAIAKFIDAIKGAMEGISDDSILSKLKPVVDQLMEKLGQFK